MGRIHITKVETFFASLAGTTEVSDFTILKFLHCVSHRFKVSGKSLYSFHGRTTDTKFEALLSAIAKSLPSTKLSPVRSVTA